MMIHWLGWLGAIVCASEWLTWFGRKFQLKKLRCFRGKHHIGWGKAALILTAVHGLAAGIEQSAVFATGLAAWLCLAFLYATYHFRRKLGSRWLRWHRVAAVAMLLLMASHAVLQIAIN